MDAGGERELSSNRRARHLAGRVPRADAFRLGTERIGAGPSGTVQLGSQGSRKRAGAYAQARDAASAARRNSLQCAHRGSTERAARPERCAGNREDSAIRTVGPAAPAARGRRTPAPGLRDAALRGRGRSGHRINPRHLAAQVLAIRDGPFWASVLNTLIDLLTDGLHATLRRVDVFGTSTWTP